MSTWGENNQEVEFREESGRRISDGIAHRREEFAQTIALEAGKLTSSVRIKVDLTVLTLKVAAEKPRRICGEIMPLDWMPLTGRREGQVRHVSLGLIVGT